MRSLFSNFSTSPNVSNLSIDYSEKHVRVYNLKRIWNWLEKNNNIFLNDAFQSYYDLFQVDWLVQN